ncbi:MAG TPA: hypothetical protein PLU75_09470 [Oscillospiraceae bacterium]|nr:hypothetical protein [Oscillospiraceae bacterium]HRW57461.1 hypothetical protein [Oscillospiraceae bacterium]
MKVILKPAKFPTKQNVNLVMREEQTVTPVTFVLMLALILVATFAIAKFAVIDQYARLNEAERAYNQVYDQRLAMDNEIADYSDVLSEYRKYSMSWLGEDEYITTDRLDVLSLIEKKMKSVGTVHSAAVIGNNLVVSMGGMNLKQISDLISSLAQEPIVQSVAVNVASTTEENAAAGNVWDAELEFSLILTLQAAEEEVLG